VGTFQLVPDKDDPHRRDAVQTTITEKGAGYAKRADEDLDASAPARAFQGPVDQGARR
jgi:hypothetical protein